MNLEPEILFKTLTALSDRPRVWVAYSGGLDSHVLLHLMHRALANNPVYQLTAIHIHHGISAQADDWVKHCQAVCTALDCPLTVLYVEGRVIGDQSPEEAARKARFTAFQNLLGAEDCLCLAHHASDQAETILWRLLRGSGPQGLGGMSQKMHRGVLEIVRPLLHVSKTAILEYARSQDFIWIEDPSNQDPRFDRNFLRQNMMPLLEDRWPKMVRSINRSGALCKETADAVEALAKKDLSQLQDKAIDQSLSVSGLLALDRLLRQTVIRLWLAEQGLQAPSYDHMQRIDREVLGAKGGAKPSLKIGHYTLRRVGNQLSVGAGLSAGPVPPP
ncbi:MAG: tRNA lysidine(34) synthetase TilS [Gammaproteobacteria bacterium]|nr:tRNA lysidine(34) synthetase TilS [Gammaproteobacteria bacterium]